MGKYHYFDFDKTICSGDSFFIFIMFLLKKSFFRQVMVVAILPPLILFYFLGGRTIAISTLLWLSTVGFLKERYDNEISEFSEQTLSANGFYYPEACSVVNELLASGSQVVVISATPTELISPMIGRVFGSRVSVHGSTTKWFWGGLVLSERMYGGKKKRLADMEYGSDARWLSGYSDHLSDIEMLKCCEEVNFVNLSDGKREKAIELIDSGVIAFHQWVIKKAAP